MYFYNSYTKTSQTTVMYNLYTFSVTVHCTLQRSHNMTFKKEFQDIGLYDLVKPYSELFWKAYLMQTDKEKALSAGEQYSVLN